MLQIYLSPLKDDSKQPTAVFHTILQVDATLTIFTSQDKMDLF